MGTFEDVDPGWFEDEIVKLFLTRLVLGMPIYFKQVESVFTKVKTEMKSWN